MASTRKNSTTTLLLYQCSQLIFIIILFFFFFPLSFLPVPRTSHLSPFRGSESLDCRISGLPTFHLHLLLEDNEVAENRVSPGASSFKVISPFRSVFLSTLHCTGLSQLLSNDFMAYVILLGECTSVAKSSG